MIKTFLDWPPVWLAGFLALGYSMRLTESGISLEARVRYLGAAFVVLGLLLMLLAAAQMHKRKTTIVPHRAPTALVTQGVFRFSRNPIYLADVFLLLGAILWWQAYAAMILVPVFMAVIEWRFIRLEEKKLKAHFGAAYDDWAANVRRWL